MIEQNIEFHNVDHLERREGMSGLQLKRFPEPVRLALGLPVKHPGRFRADRAHGCELRFVTAAGYFELALTAAVEDIDVTIYCGDITHSVHRLKAGVLTVLHIERNEILESVEEERIPKGRFSFQVWRVAFGLGGSVYFHWLDTFGFGHRPPLSEEKPALTWAAYGSSITCGAACRLYSNCYLEQTALRLRIDVENKGLSGACLLEPEAARYLASLDVDIVTLEVGVNMMLRFTDEEFQARLSYLLETMKKSRAKKIFVIDMFPNKGLIGVDQESANYRHYRSFKEITRKLAGQMQADDDRFTSVRGEDVMKDLTCLSADLLHPSDNGHILMGGNLAEILREEMGYKI